MDRFTNQDSQDEDLENGIATIVEQSQEPVNPVAEPLEPEGIQQPPQKVVEETPEKKVRKPKKKKATEGEDLRKEIAEISTVPSRKSSPGLDETKPKRQRKQKDKLDVGEVLPDHSRSEKDLRLKAKLRGLDIVEAIIKGL